MRTETKVSQGAIIKNKGLKTGCQGRVRSASEGSLWPTPAVFPRSNMHFYGAKPHRQAFGVLLKFSVAQRNSSTTFPLNERRGKGAIRSCIPHLSSRKLKLSFDTIFYYVSDMESAIAFYRDTLGLQMVSRDYVARFDLDGVLIELVPRPPGTWCPAVAMPAFAFL